MTATRHLNAFNHTLSRSVRLHVLPHHTNSALPTSRTNASPSFMCSQPIGNCNTQHQRLHAHSQTSSQQTIDSTLSQELLYRSGFNFSLYCLAHRVFILHMLQSKCAFSLCTPSCHFFTSVLIFPSCPITYHLPRTHYCIFLSVYLYDLTISVYLYDLTISVLLLKFVFPPHFPTFSSAYFCCLDIQSSLLP